MILLAEWAVLNRRDYCKTIIWGNVLCVIPDLQENNVKLKLTIIDTLGYGDQIDKSDRCGLNDMLLLLADNSSFNVMHM